MDAPPRAAHISEWPWRPAFQVSGFTFANRTFRPLARPKASLSRGRKPRLRAASGRPFVVTQNGRACLNWLGGKCEIWHFNAPVRASTKARASEYELQILAPASIVGLRASQWGRMHTRASEWAQLLRTFAQLGQSCTT